jgi:hypothetical protein
VGIILSEEATQNWRSQGGNIIKGGIIGDTTGVLSLHINIVKSNSNNATSLLIATEYLPDFGREKSQYEEMSDKEREFVA